VAHLFLHDREEMEILRVPGLWLLVHPSCS
jgi:hypothetical protein